ncbi:hypothetical protein BUQ74_20715 [Leptospira weilii serovar Heyan]|uniref:hypothetical protein n=1 Tax=Leptospira weilii TaxID=28184 RepID=UPI0002FFFAA4|nr:hypothetical protein [Leptospira weilii]OMI14633.1 hypothetical protein BUQ74_20715 [Leptospira weilii serovar Heyan]ULH26815.1 hypothetical protein FH586_00110 [Leptospira weilii]ULH30736.1 hypothetical protein FH586_21635 [Leptospira weilii]ULH30913.1 hypothetical protein FH586_21890 [Leptospira weilii]
MTDAAIGEKKKMTTKRDPRSKRNPSTHSQAKAAMLNATRIIVAFQLFFNSENESELVMAQEL